MFASGSRTQIGYVAETTYNVTPATPQLILLPKQSSTLDFSKTLYSDPTIVGDRMLRDSRHGNVTVAGDLVTTLQHQQWDDLLEATLGGTWTSNVLKVGSVPRSFTFEEGFKDVGQYRVFTGVRLNTFKVDVNPGSIVSATYGVMGSGMTTASTSLDATPTPVIAGKLGMSHIGGSISIAGSPVVCTAASIQISNAMVQAWGIGSATAKDVVTNESDVTGSCTFYFEDLVQYNYFLNEVAASLSITLSDGTNSLTFLIPNAKFNTGALPVPGSGLLFMTMSFQGLYDATTDTTVQITRT